MQIPTYVLCAQMLETLVKKWLQQVEIYLTGLIQ